MVHVPVRSSALTVTAASPKGNTLPGATGGHCCALKAIVALSVLPAGRENGWETAVLRVLSMVMLTLPAPGARALDLMASLVLLQMVPNLMLLTVLALLLVTLMVCMMRWLPLTVVWRGDGVDRVSNQYMNRRCDRKGKCIQIPDAPA